jgi:hypothetical protein
MFETLAVFHLPMSSLNVGLLANIDAMLVTAAVFQYPIGPYVIAAVVGLVAHAVTAVSMLASAMHVSMPAFPQAQVGYAACSVAPHIRYIVPSVEVESDVVESKADARLLTRSTFHAARFWLKAAALLNICEHTES